MMRMIETYAPSTQAVVMVVFEGQNPITVKMKLERPFVLDEAAGVH